MSNKNRRSYSFEEFKNNVLGNKHLFPKMEYIEEKMKNSKEFEPGIIYFDESSICYIEERQVFNKNLRFYHFLSKQCDFMNNLNKALSLGNMREFYSFLCKFYNEDVYIVRETGNTKVPFILTKDIRVIIYSYIPYKFKKEDIKLIDSFYQENFYNIMEYQNIAKNLRYYLSSLINEPHGAFVGYTDYLRFRGDR